MKAEQSSCPFCGSSVAPGARLCTSCNLSLKSYRGEPVATGAPVFTRRASMAGAGGGIVLIAFASLARLAVDSAPYDWVTAAGIALILYSIIRLSGLFAAVLAFAMLLATDFFLISPRLALGISSWRGTALLLAVGSILIVLAWIGKPRRLPA